MMLVGLTFVTLTFSNRLFSVGPAFEEMTDGFRPVMQTASLATLNGDIDGLAVAAQDFQTKILPLAAQQAKVTPEQLAGSLAAGFPAVMKGISETPAITTQFRGVVEVLSAEQQRFAKADQIPTASLPATTVPWTLLSIGVVLMGLGAVMFRPGKKAIAAGLVIGIALVAVPFVLSLPGKASAADKMNADLKPVYTQQLVTGAAASLATVQAMAVEMNAKLLPAFAQQAGVSVPQFQQQLGLAAPGLAAAIQNMPAALERFTTAVDTFRANLDEYDSIKSVSLVPIVWTLIAGGAVTFLVAATLVFERRPAAFDVRAVPSRKAA